MLRMFYFPIFLFTMPSTPHFSLSRSYITMHTLSVINPTSTHYYLVYATEDIFAGSSRVSNQLLVVKFQNFSWQSRLAEISRSAPRSTTPTMASLWPCSRQILVSETKSHKIIEVSLLPEARVNAFLEIAREITALPWPSSSSGASDS